MNGTVKWFSNRKGYGFISGDDEQDYFVHYTSLGNEFAEHGRRNLLPEQKVTFGTTKSNKGLQAIGVRMR